MRKSQAQQIIISVGPAIKYFAPDHDVGESYVSVRESGPYLLVTLDINPETIGGSFMPPKATSGRSRSCFSCWDSKALVKPAMSTPL
jgi:hypothetical protein